MEIEQEAALQGWVPKESFKGDEAKWVSAEEYVERGKHIMPILQSNNKRLMDKIQELEGTVESLNTSVSSAQESMEALKEFHQESTKAQVEKARRELLADLKAAKSDGDIEQEIQLTSELSQFDAAQLVAKNKPATVPVPAAKTEQLAPETVEWMAANPWYGTDLERTGLMDGIAKRMRAEGTPLMGKAFLEAAGGLVKERLGEDTQRFDKVESGGRGSGGSGSVVRGYSGLPADARAICDKQASRFVGADRVYKTNKEWQEFFVSEYNKGN